MVSCVGERGRSPFVGGRPRKPWLDGYLTTSADASPIDSRILDWDSQNNLSCKDSHSYIPISTAAGVLILVIVTCSWVIDAASTKALSWFITLETGSVGIQQWQARISALEVAAPRPATLASTAGTLSSSSSGPFSG